MIRHILASLLLGLTLAQDTHFCNDGWELYTSSWAGEEHHSCFWFGERREQVTHDSAKLLCNAMGGFMAEVPYGPHLNNWIVNKLLEKYEKAVQEADTRRPDYGVQYWLGARDFGHHNDHLPGTWMWEHRNTSIEWFDWGDNEPNNFNGQNCLSYLHYESIFGFSEFKWNDWDCDAPADFICEIILD
ncbi:perlucin-like protein [Eurytemora carolleeae]|uniref:perlucin-like protein n=1 Tax=Eurytemora carolleeae TaxID=1294199 RepID=UPI000C76B89C|nr:perlucin-like protein [Eurytemora carolleeae]|eukprot:XP_023331642.1 perlucin-like protein [Eurytemora affinis]